MTEIEIAVNLLEGHTCDTCIFLPKPAVKSVTGKLFGDVCLNNIKYNTCEKWEKVLEDRFHIGLINAKMAKDLGWIAKDTAKFHEKIKEAVEGTYAPFVEFGTKIKKKKWWRK